ncbi:MGMT family protein [Halobellus limi]|uniref:Methylated-DNA--[protein]-cysteine S-methyltransferase n=1 Tax=Halobellus limi TaxID=699433 RepID=A0A1H5YVX3_9EURY|nr:MGMT family protein [Halobellus limi]QCC48339.1 methylated-DNA--[protein]-cysteine S-methyltransferase [Halobellus limi]SEG27396.1 methylated-DNA-[protein]-cysteine S-methyltransferase [Halobellus limi]
MDLGTDDGIFARESDRLDRAVEIGVASGRVVGVSFPETVPADADPDHPVLDRIFAYLDGEADHLADVEVGLTVPTENRRVLEAARNVPYGETVSLDRVVRMAGLDPDDSADVETARTALSENPIPLLVPDHRVRDAPGGAPEEVAARLREIESA